MTGLGLGITFSIKWVGLFTIGWVGSLTLIQLWVLLGDTKTVTMVSAPLELLKLLPGNSLTYFLARFCQTLYGAAFLLDRDPNNLLHGHVRHPLCLPCQPR